MRADDVLVRDERDERPARPVVCAPCPAERIRGCVIRDVSDFYMYTLHHITWGKGGKGGGGAQAFIF